MCSTLELILEQNLHENLLIKVGNNERLERIKNISISKYIDSSLVKPEAISIRSVLFK